MHQNLAQPACEGEGQETGCAEPFNCAHAPRYCILLAPAGYGILFFWQLGVMQYLEQTYDLSKCTMVGSSAGSMLSVLAACNVKPQVRLKCVA
jgi:hypothetical protein